MRIDFEISPRAKRALKVAAAGVIVLGGSVALANVPNTFKSGDALSAQSMNDNFTALDTRLAKLETLTAKASGDGGYSLGATFCGASSSTTKGDLSGLSVTGTTYVKARTQCQTTCAAPSAHLCAGDELTRSVQLGVAPTTGWYSSSAGTSGFAECLGWTNTSSAQFGPAWSGSGQSPQYASCDTLYPILCCN
jgi:hypothetical protein